MKITKWGQSCVVIEVSGVRFLVDPGSYSAKEADFGKIDAILITHGHQDHLDIERLRSVLDQNPTIITNQEVADRLKNDAIKVDTIKAGETRSINGVQIESFGEAHEPVHSSFNAGANTAFLIDNAVFLPGDSYVDPKRKIKLLALAVSGPWVRLSEAIDYALQLKPKIVIPVHDANLIQFGTAHSLPEKVLGAADIKFQPLKIGEVMDIIT